MLAQPGGEGGVLALPADPDVGGGEPGAAEQQVHARRLAGDVLADGGRGAGGGVGVGGGVLAVLAQGAVGPPAAPVEARRTAPEAPPLDPGHLRPEHQVPDVLGPGVGDKGRLG